MHWQIVDTLTSEVSYYDPARFAFHLNGCRLRNQPATARKIHEGANKSVCAWIDCEGILVTNFGGTGLPEFIEAGKAETNTPKVAYNPKVAPNWRNDAGDNVDGSTFAQLFVAHRSVFCS